MRRVKKTRSVVYPATECLLSLADVEPSRTTITSHKKKDQMSRINQRFAFMLSQRE